MLYTQLTAEVRTDKGWEAPSGKRNEAFDLIYYCMGLCRDPRIALESVDWERPPAWAAEWDANVLVFEGSSQPNFARKRNESSLEDLANLLT